MQISIQTSQQVMTVSKSILGRDNSCWKSAGGLSGSSGSHLAPSPLTQKQMLHLP